MRAVVLGLASILALTGCSAFVHPDEGQLGGDGGTPTSDAGHSGYDSGRPMRDAGLPTTDGSLPPPPPPADGGSACTTGPQCDGDVLVTCAGGTVTRTDCEAMRSFCASGQCHGWVCMPGETACSPDRTHLITCDSRGAHRTATSCPSGCDPSTSTCNSAPPPPPACAGLPTISLGDTETFNLCSASGMNTYQGTDACNGSYMANSNDATFALTVTSPTDVVITLSDADSSTFVDTVVYVRTVCDQQSSQVACNDDIPCSQSTLPGPCMMYRLNQSIITTHLDPGTYYIVADAFVYRNGGGTSNCGTVTLNVSTP